MLARSAVRTWNIEHGYHGKVEVTHHGVTGTVCDKGFNENAARAICRQKGFKGGVPLGAEYGFTKPELVWFSNVTCPANASGMSDCKVNTTVSESCRQSTLPSGVLCYKVSGEHEYLFQVFYLDNRLPARNYLLVVRLR